LENGTTSVPAWLTISAGRLSWTEAAEAGTYNFIVKCTKSGLTTGTLTVNLVIVSTTPVGSNPPKYKNAKYSSETSSSIVLNQNETRDIIFATDDAKQNSNLIYSYVAISSMPNITISNFVNQDDATYGRSAKINLTANGTISSYAYSLLVYVYDTKTMQTSVPKYPFTISILQSPTS
jgi:hypothetical protein